MITVLGDAQNCSQLEQRNLHYNHLNSKAFDHVYKRRANLTTHAALRIKISSPLHYWLISNSFKSITSLGEIKQNYYNIHP